MRLSSLAILMILTTVILSACAQDKMASVEDRGQQYYGRGMAPMTLASGGSQQWQTSAHTAPTAQNAAYENVSSNDLAPPTIQNISTPHVPQQAVVQVVPKPAVAAPVVSWQWPVDGHVIENYGSQGSGVVNEGITIAAKKGTPIRAAAPGQVAFVGSQLKDYGNMVILRHADGTMSAYSHAQEIIVAKGDNIRQGAVLGYVGQSGNAPQPELHFAVRSGDHAVDPVSLLPQQTASN